MPRRVAQNQARPRGDRGRSDPVGRPDGTEAGRDTLDIVVPNSNVPNISVLINDGDGDGIAIGVDNCPGVSNASSRRTRGMPTSTWLGATTSTCLAASRGFLAGGASRARTGDLLGAIERRGAPEDTDGQQRLF